MTTIQTNKRLGYLDALRGFTMLLVVFSHIELGSFGIHSYDSVIAHIFVSFRMPMFFFISGYIGYKVLEKWDKNFLITTLKKKALIQLIPTAVFFSLSCFCFGGNPLSFFTYGLGGYWFTLVLFEMFAIYAVTSYISKLYKIGGGKLFDISMIILGILGILILVFLRGDGQLWRVLCMENLTKYFQFFALGILCRKYNKQFISFITNDMVIAVLTVLFVALMVLIHQVGDIRSAYGVVGSFIHDILERYLGLLIVFSLFYKNKEYFEKDTKINKWIIFVGRRTLDIYLIHFFLIPRLPFITPIIDGNKNVALELVITLSLSIIIIAICLIISKIIRNSNFLGKYLFGAK